MKFIMKIKMKKTTILITPELRDKLNSLKNHEKESYEDLIWDLIDNTLDLKTGFIEELEEQSKQIKNKEIKTVDIDEI